MTSRYAGAPNAASWSDSWQYRENVPETSPLAVVLTALPLECRAVLAHLADVEERVHRGGSRVQLGRLPDSGWRVAVAEIGEGAERTAAFAAQLVAWLEPEDPHVLLFVGVAGSLKDDVRLGDVVVATKVYSIHGGKEARDGQHVRPEAWFPSHPLEQAARSALRGRTRVHFKPVAVGDVVLADPHAPLAARLRQSFNDAVAIEMESSGLLHAAHLNGPLLSLVVRGISDQADTRKDAVDASGSQERAAAAAAEAAVAVLHTYEPAGARYRTPGATHSVAALSRDGSREGPFRRYRSTGCRKAGCRRAGRQSRGCRRGTTSIAT